MERRVETLLPSQTQLESLSDEKVKALVVLADNQSKRTNSYAMLGMACGTLSFLASLGSYVYLVYQKHDTAAGAVLGATVLAIIGRMIQGREAR